MRGGTNAEIAKQLFISEATVKKHIRSMLLHRTQLVIEAYESGIVWAERR